MTRYYRLQDPTYLPTACVHPDTIYLYPATNEDGEELAVLRCIECGAKHFEVA